jgi:RNA polymerase sigma-70 factor (ECF subfamily)
MKAENGKPMTEHALAMQATCTDPDVLLVRAMADGDTHALDELYARYGPGLLVYLTGQLGDRQAAEEVLQDVMLAAWTGAAAFRGESRVQTWLLVIARHRAINLQRRRVLPHAPLDETVIDRATGPQEQAEREDECATLRRMLQTLPDDQRQTLELIFYHELSGQEAAAVLGVAAGTIKSRLHRAKSAVRKLWYAREDHDS